VDGFSGQLQHISFWRPDSDQLVAVPVSGVFGKALALMGGKQGRV
jgi:hypothetical protein